MKPVKSQNWATPKAENDHFNKKLLWQVYIFLLLPSLGLYSPTPSSEKHQTRQGANKKATQEDKKSKCLIYRAHFILHHIE